MLNDDLAWAAVQRRDRSFDGRFVTGVLTTGIYCRPSCAARHPSRENVRFFASGADARAAGLRPCKRCLPDDVARDEAAVLAAIDEIKQGVDGADSAPSLDELAQLTGYSPSHFQRVFKRATGLSPAAYARALRAERARDALSGGASVTEAIYEAGYSGPSRFYDDARGRLGMAPSAWADGGQGVTIHWAVVPTTIGPMLVAATDKGVCRLSFDEDEAELRRRFPKADLVQGGAEFEKLLAEVVASVESPGDFAHIPLDVKGTAFQEACWKALREIPPGETRSYADIAAAAGNPKAVRAAGSANARNNVAVLIPCHRVIRSDGDLGGYAYGLDIKRELLAREKQG
ncbi:bifunctional DNA-binding transcriptional regulator/O6-methylguanine-DNA methyltransferase Ada [Pelagerythrobacter aerophilus]|uniref:methylated-DNA--[protein]-cysteine S-methyltransferase n=1 Tax=Pelagerythrobacter aerophilus TaxID=2306995 RepID=A0A418NFV0_9SPHN|nr:bifunctional DNA-binding transcriptional regulator/O6-methylguanine-DNA methyltransferase Ada [Pelagerythrobacter aerophilus]RIV76747.1 bifunctional DNA-binding transcriptional regulator/O6-methylguanine-DNA methyltransferase Ada [Pelagerythrobacter aerophilus]